VLGDGDRIEGFAMPNFIKTNDKGLHRFCRYLLHQRLHCGGIDPPLRNAPSGTSDTMREETMPVCNELSSSPQLRWLVGAHRACSGVGQCDYWAPVALRLWVHVGGIETRKMGGQQFVDALIDAPRCRC
jgi:hypothetical protein